MFNCTLCSLLSFLFDCASSVVWCALEYPIVVLLISIIITLALITNIHSAKMICNYGLARRRGALGGNRAVTILRSFDYGPDLGPHTWSSPTENQSPINILTDCAQSYPIREMLTWNHYDDLPLGNILENNGNTVLLRGCFAGNTPTVSGADLLACYTFVELCFRWSDINTDGSEHMINNRKYPLEMQAMHRTGPATEAISSYDLLMISYFFEISASNPYLDPIIQNLYRVQHAGTQVEIAPFPLSYLCHPFRTGFYSYAGSLTEPPCYQGAEWFVFPEPMAISERQINEFRQLLSGDNRTRILRNSRPVQDLTPRRIVNLNIYNPHASSTDTTEPE